MQQLADLACVRVWRAGAERFKVLWSRIRTSVAMVVASSLGEMKTVSQLEGTSPNCCFSVSS